MKVAFLMHDDYAGGGLQRSTLAAAEALGEAGYDVRVYCLKTLDDGFSSTRANVVALVPPGTSKARYWFRVFAALRNLIRRGGLGAMIGMGLAPSVLVGLAGRKDRGCLLVGSERSHPPVTPNPAPWRLLRRLSYRRLDRIVCQTNATRDWFERALGIPRRCFRVIPNIVRTPSPRPPGLIDLPPAFRGHPLVAGIGRLDGQKGFDDALEIFARVGKAVPDARFLIVGDGPDGTALRAQATRLGIAEQVLFLPRLPDLSALWPKLSLFLLTSRYEGIPNVLAEAMANGVATVAYDCLTGPSDLIDDGTNGFLVPVGDIEAATSKVVAVLRDDGLRRALGQKGRALPERFSKAEIGARWNALVDGC